LAQRASAGIKVRQPLASVDVPEDTYHEIIKDELNVKVVNLVTDSNLVKLDTRVDEKLQIEGLMRELIRHIQNGRKKAGLQVENRIELVINTSDKLLVQAIKEHANTIQAETLATALSDKLNRSKYTESITVDGAKATIGISKA
jgi:isoleucyl-tRNA synthetase